MPHIDEVNKWHDHTDPHIYHIFCVPFNTEIVLSMSIFMLRHVWFMLQYRFGQLAPPMYTETLPGDQSLALLITSLTEGMAGMYYCSASYANTEQLEIAVKVETYGNCSWRRITYLTVQSAFA